MPEVRLIGIAGGFIELRSKDILVSQFIKREPDATNTRKQVYELQVCHKNDRILPHKG